jgi:hypothetical protein
MENLGLIRLGFALLEPLRKLIKQLARKFVWSSFEA